MKYFTNNIFLKLSISTPKNISCTNKSRLQIYLIASYIVYYFKP